MKSLYRQALFVFVIILILYIGFGEAHSQEMYFLQNEGNTPIIKLYNNAYNKIYVVAYVITDANITNALLNASSRGLEVKLLLDERQILGSKFSQHLRLNNGEIEIRVLGASSARIVSEFGIIDDNIVYTGGTFLHSDIEANPKVGNYNIYMNNSGITGRLTAEFMRLFNEGRILRPR